VLPPGACAEVHADGPAASPARIELRHAESGGWDWSGALALDAPGETLLRLRHRGRGVSEVLRCDVREGRPAGTWTATVAAVGDDSFGGAFGGDSSGTSSAFMPYRIENFTRDTLRFHQRGCGARDDALPPYNAAEYAWDEPLAPRQLVLAAPGRGHLGTFALDDVGAERAVRLRAAGGRPGRRLLVRIAADGPTRVLSVTDTELHPPAAAAPAAPAAPGAPAAAALLRRGGGAAFAPPPPFGGEERLELFLDLAGVGLSVVGTTEELLYATMSGIRLLAAQSRLEQTLHVAASRLQVDNTLRRTTCPVMLACGAAPGAPWAAPLGAAAAAAKDAAASAMRRVEREIAPAKGGGAPQPAATAAATQAAPVAAPAAGAVPPAGAQPAPSGAAAAAAAASAAAARPRPAAISFAFARWRRRPGGVVCVREALLDVAPLSLELDDELVESLPAAAEALWRPHRDRLAASASPATSGLVPPAAGGKVYVERLRVSPLSLRLTARRLPFAPRGVKALAGVEGAVIELPALELAHPLLRAAALAQHAQRHYQRAALAALASLLGSASLLGDPVGLAAALRRAAWRLLGGDDDPGGAAAASAPNATTNGDGTPRGARRFALDLLFAVSDAVRKSSGAARAVALRWAIELEARVQRAATRPTAAAGGTGTAASQPGSARGVLGRRTPLAATPAGATPRGARSAADRGVLMRRSSFASAPPSPAVGSTSASGASGGDAADVAASESALAAAAEAAAGDADVLSALVHGLAGLIAAPFVGLERGGIAGLLEGAALGVGGAVARPAASAFSLALRGATALRDAVRAATAPPPPRRARPPRVVPPPGPGAPPLPRYSLEHAAGAAILRAATAPPPPLPTPLGRMPPEAFRGAWALAALPDATGGDVADAAAAAAMLAAAAAAAGAASEPVCFLVLTPAHALVGAAPGVGGGGPDWVVAWAASLADVLRVRREGATLRLLLLAPLRVRCDAAASAAARRAAALATLDRGGGAADAVDAAPAQGAAAPGSATGSAAAAIGAGAGSVVLAPRGATRLLPPRAPLSHVTMLFADAAAAAAAEAALARRPRRVVRPVQVPMLTPPRR
jgi:hypothetical protein